MKEYIYLLLKDGKVYTAFRTEAEVVDYAEGMKNDWEWSIMKVEIETWTEHLG